MGEHDTWFHLLPGAKNLEHTLAGLAGKGWVFGEELHGTPHIFMSVFVFAIVVFLALRYRAAVASAGDDGIVPERRFNARMLVETIAGATLGMMSGVMGEKAAKRFLPLIGTLAFFIFFCNIMALIPGFLPATDTLTTTMACAAIIFVATHVYGLQANGFGHIKHLMGPVWWLAPLMFVIEVVSHLARPLSLALRLMGNMVGDHKVLGLFLTLVPLLVPLPIMVLGIIVCTVQTLVFCLLSVVYIGMAIETHHEEGEHAH